MADKAVKGNMGMSQLREEIAGEESTLAEWEGVRADFAGLIEAGSTAPDDIANHTEAQKGVDESNEKLKDLRRRLAVLEGTLPQKPTPQTPKFDPEKHPLLKKATEKVEPAKPVEFRSGSVCEALYSDRQWYKATVLTVLGSASDPKYHIRWADYEDETATVDRDSIRPVVNEKKRKAEPAPATQPAPAATSSPHVISGPASMNPDAVAAKKDASAEPAVGRARKTIGSRKALERKGDAWKKFLAKGPGKQIAKKDSMFRSGTGVDSRVGFTGSGAGMTTTSKRVRYDSKADRADEQAEARRADQERGPPKYDPASRFPNYEYEYQPSRARRY